MDSYFARLPAVVDEGRRVVNNLQRTAALFVTKTIFAFFLTLVFTTALLIERDPNVQYPFATNHLYLWEIVTSGFAAFFLALEKNSEKIEGRFLTNVFKKAIPAATLLITSVLLIFGFYLMQRHNVLNFGIYSKDTAIAMSVITFSVLGIVFLYRVCSPFTKYRKIVFICSAAVNAVVLIATAIVSFALNLKEPEPVLKIPYYEMNGPAVITMVIIIVLFAAIYLFVHQIIAINKGEKEENED